MLERSRVVTRSRWLLPVSSVGLGAVMLAAARAGGHPGLGLVLLAIMAAFGLLVLLAGQSETIRGLRGDGRDERFAQIDQKATAVTGLVLILVLIAAFLAEIARGHSGNPYAWLGAIAGLTYMAAVGYFRWRG